MRRWNRFAALCLPLLLGTASFHALASDAPAPNLPIEVEPGQAPAEPVVRVDAIEPREPDFDSDLDPNLVAAQQAFDQQLLGGTPEQRRAADTTTNTSTTNYWLQTLSALGIVILLIFGLRWVLRRMSGAGAVGGGTALVEVLARTPIGNKTQIVFLRVNERVIVAGQTPAGLNTLAEIDRPEEVASVLQHVESSRPTSISRSFAKMLGQADAEGNAAVGFDTDEHVVDRTRDGLSGLMDRIRRLRSEDDR